MGAIVDKVKKMWGGSPYTAPSDLLVGIGCFAEEIESQIESLRQEIQALKGKKQEPQAPLPPEQWEPGDVLGCINSYTKQKRVGIFHHISGYNEGNRTGDVKGYWQNKDGTFLNVLTYRGLNTDQVTFEFRPEK